MKKALFPVNNAPGSKIPRCPLRQIAAVAAIGFLPALVFGTTENVTLDSATKNVQNPYIRFSEPNALGTLSIGPFSPAVHFDLTDLANYTKRGISMDIRTNQSGSECTPTNPHCLNTGGIAIAIHTPPDNGGDVSGIYVRSTGGGNAISAYAYGDEYPNNGRVIEAAAAHSKHSILSFAQDGIAFFGQTTGNGAIFVAKPVNDGDMSRRAFQVTNADYDSEKFFITLGGYVHTNGSFFSLGSIQTFTNIVVGWDQVVGYRNTGWTAGTGSSNKGAMNYDTATSAQLAARVKALEDMLRYHGLID